MDLLAILERKLRHLEGAAEHLHVFLIEVGDETQLAHGLAGEVRGPQLVVMRNGLKGVGRNKGIGEAVVIEALVEFDVFHAIALEHFVVAAHRLELSAGHDARAPQVIADPVGIDRRIGVGCDDGCDGVDGGRLHHDIRIDEEQIIRRAVASGEVARA